MGRRYDRWRLLGAWLIVAALAFTAIGSVAAAEPPAFAPGQLWSIKTPAASRIKVIVGLVEPGHDTTVVHVSLIDVPIPPGLPDAGGMTAIDHLPFTEAALAGSVDRLLASDVDPPAQFTVGYQLWLANQGGVYTTGVARTLEVIFEALRRGKPPPSPERRTERREWRAARRMQ